MTEARICAKLRQSHRQKSRYPPHLGRQSSEPGLRLKLYFANFHSRIFNGGSDSDPPFLVYQSLSGAGADAVFTRAAAPASERTTGMSMQGRRPGMRIPGSVAEASEEAKRRWDGYTASQLEFREEAMRKRPASRTAASRKLRRSEETLRQIHGMPTGVPG